MLIEKRIAEGKVAAVILAGGEGTRLGFAKPKGLFPISPLANKTLLQIFCEKVRALEKALGASLRLAIMCSKNKGEIANYLEENAFFGLKKLVLFSQTEKDAYPNGNGALYESMKREGIFSLFRKEDIEDVTVLPIDNPLADPFHFALIEKKLGKDVSLIATENPGENMGLVVRQGKRFSIIEYFEKEGKTAPLGNTNLFCFSRSFMEKMAEKKLPYHEVKKKKGRKLIIKKERFLFDVLPFAEKMDLLVLPKEECFAPLKRKRGCCGIKETREALLIKDQKILERITKRKQRVKVELAMPFHYPTKKLLKEWNNKAIIKKQYIEV